MNLEDLNYVSPVQNAIKDVGISLGPVVFENCNVESQEQKYNEIPPKPNYQILLFA